MVGVKSIALVCLAPLAAAIAGARGLLDPSYLASLSAATCAAIGLVTSAAASLVAAGWRPGEPSRTALDLRRRRLAARPRGGAEWAPRELPAAVQRALLAVTFAGVALGAFDNRATARLAALPAALAEPSPSAVCPDESAPRPGPPPGQAAAAAAAAAEIPGCALVRRAYQLGYADTLGSCAPRVVAPAPVASAPPCTRRQRDEPFLHFGWRRLVDRFDSLAGADPIDAVARGARAIGVELDHLDTLVAHQRHAVAATRRASHHLWINLPAPTRDSGLRSLLDAPRCASRYERMPLWPSWEGAERPASALVDHVLGLLLFAPGFAVAPAQCGDHVIHWDAPADACRRLIADPAGFLARAGALEAVREVLDRRRRQIEMGRLDAELGRRAHAGPPPDARAIVSLQCLAIDPAAPRAGAVSGRDVLVDGHAIAVRELRVPAVRASGAGPIDVYRELASLLAGDSLAGGGETAPGRAAPRAAADLSGGGGDYLLTRLESLRDADPFAGASWPLERADVVEVYPFRRHLHAFVEAFRRRYWAERGRM
ncbi:MAG TPA: hypothetical protein VKB80_29100 [Kofleriaceae bacterium]|nr:hypothetical protein [Kofleriaceae bacterium]